MRKALEAIKTRAKGFEAPASPFVRATFWTVTSYALGQLLRFGSNVVLFRLLFAEAFGLMALVNAFVQALQMFSDIGIGPSIVSSRRGDDPRFLNTAWSLQALRGALIGLLCIVAAGPVAALYDEPQLRTIIPVTGCAAVLQGLLSTRLFTAQRALSLGRLTAIELVSQGVAAAVMVAWALVSPSVWALAAGSLASAAITLTLSHSLLPGIRNRFVWDPIAARELARFGRWIFVSTLLTFVALQSDRLIFGMLVPLGTLGIYSIAQALATLPSALVGTITHRAVFPHLSRERNADRPLGPAYRRVRLPVALVAAALYSGLVVVGPTLVDELYGARARDAGWMMQLLAIGGFLSSLRLLGGSPLLALGMPRHLAVAHGAKVLTMAAFLPLGHAIAGFPGAILGLALSDLSSYAVVLGVTVTKGVGAPVQDALLTLAALSMIGIGLLFGAACRELGFGAWTEIASTGSLLLLGWALLWKLFAGARTNEERRWSAVVRSA